MMDQERAKAFSDDLEDGELSDSDDGYTPLPRPGNSTSIGAAPSLVVSDEPVQMEEAIEDSGSEFGGSSSSTSDSDDCLKLNQNPNDAEKQQKKRTKRTVLLRVKNDGIQNSKARFKKYDIWGSSLQEDALTENMRGIDVALDGRCDRSVESYDYTLKYRLNGDNSLKRRLSTSSDEQSDDDLHPQAKRSRASGVKSRLGSRNSSSDHSSNEPRLIPDLTEPVEGKSPEELAKEMSEKLCEEQDELIARSISVAGPDIIVQLFKETQRIEKDGGMMILNGSRRRTPGGVFLFLLKNHETITADEKKVIFCENRKASYKKQREIRAVKRHRKVEELKKRLSAKEKNLARKDRYLGSELKPELKSTLSNPPPSPVGLEHSPEYKLHAINHVVADVSPEKPCTSKAIDSEIDQITCDDVLDIHCGTMDFC